MGRTVLRDDVGRHGRRGHQDREPTAENRGTRRLSVRRQRERAVHDAPSQQEERHARSEESFEQGNIF